MTDAIAGQVGGGAIHNRLALAWGQGPGGPGADLIRRILVLMADHELNPSAFAARVAASITSPFPWYGLRMSDVCRTYA